mgnify:CR=1 FL=1
MEVATDININHLIISNLDDIELLFCILNSNLENSNLNKKVLFRGINQLVDIDIKKAIVILNKLASDDISLFALKIKAYSQIPELIDNAIFILNSLPKKHQKKRMFTPILKSLIRIDYKKAFDFLVEMSKLFKLIESDLSDFFLLDVNKDVLYEIMSMNEIVLSSSSSLINPLNITEIKSRKCLCCGSELQKINLADLDISKLKENILRTYIPSDKIDLFTDLESLIRENNYNVFIDGGNVLYYKSRKIVLNSFVRLKNIFVKIKSLGYNPLIILHRRQKDYLKKNLGLDFIKAKKILESMEDIYYTPYKMNDDWFFIYAGIIIENSFVVTNDLLRDHIFKISEEDLISNSLSRWIKNSIITYDTIENRIQIQSVELNFPQDISIKIQKVSGRWHFPISDDRWICV